MPAFTIKLDKWEYTLPKEVSTFEMDRKCFLNAMWNETATDAHVFIGQPFMQSFSLFMDYDSDTMSFGVNKESKLTASISGPPPTADPGLSGWEKFTITILVFAFLILAIVALYYGWVCYNKRNERQGANAIAYQHV